MAQWKLSSKQWDALDELRFSTPTAKVFRNVTIILLSAAGNSKPQIAYELGCSLATVDNVRKAYRERGLEGLVPRTSPGRPSRATPAYRELLRVTVKTSPQTLGYGFSVWSLARLGQHLKQKTGISLSEDQLGRVLRGGFLLPAAQTHDEGQTQRGRLPAGSPPVESARKKARWTPMATRY